MNWNTDIFAVCEKIEDKQERITQEEKKELAEFAKNWKPKIKKMIGSWTYAGHHIKNDCIDFYFEENCSKSWIKRVVDCVKPNKVLYLTIIHIYDDLYRVYYSYDKNKFDRNDFVITQEFLNELEDDSDSD